MGCARLGLRLLGFRDFVVPRIALWDALVFLAHKAHLPPVRQWLAWDVCTIDCDCWYGNHEMILMARRWIVIELPTAGAMRSTIG